MTLEELKDFNEHISALRKYAEALIEEQAQQPQAPKIELWEPEAGQSYWFICNDHDIVEAGYCNSGYDERRIKIYNCFQTQEEAGKEALRTRARRKLEWLARELNKGKQTDYGWAIMINPNWNKTKTEIHILNTDFSICGVIAFAEKSDAEYALSQMTAEELEALR